MTDPQPGDDRTVTRHRVFVSSTSRDQDARHRQVADIVRAMGFEPVSMFDFPAEIVPPEQGDAEKLEVCAVALFVIGYRYGSCPEGDERSYVELEFEAAKQANTDRLVFLIDETKEPMVPDGPGRNVDDGPDWADKLARLNRFKQRLASSDRHQALTAIGPRAVAIRVHALVTHGRAVLHRRPQHTSIARDIAISASELATTDPARERPRLRSGPPVNASSSID